MRTFAATILLVLSVSTATALEHCTASYYWQGSVRADGKRYNPDEVLCAHKTLKLGTKVRVTNRSNGKSVVCKILDRGPYIRGRCIDLSRGAARLVGMTGAGIVPATVEVIQ